MSRPAPARSRIRPGEHRGRRGPAPRAPRRVSGPARYAPRPAPRPATAPASAPAAALRARTVPRAARVPDRIVDRLLRSRLWIVIVGALLGGIVAMQVSLLKLNAGISRAVETAATLERQNGALEAAIARLGATERIRSTAESRGMVLPPAGEVEYLRARHGDAARAAAIMQPPSDAAKAVLANGGIDPATIATSGATIATETAVFATEPAPVATEPVPVATEPVPVATEPAPVATEPAPVATAP
jgi:hypothetical protein